MARTLDVKHLIDPDQVATEIASKWDEWNGYRNGWLDERKELRNYVYATDTRTTSNSRLPWSNSTTTPKLTQIYDNLKANYAATLFPNSDWLRWKGDDPASANPHKALAVKSYMKRKMRQSQFEVTVDRLLDDWILTGNCFATVDYSRDITMNGKTAVERYIGPKLVRISPYDIVFDPTAADFMSTPKVIRSIKTLGELHVEAEQNEGLKALLSKMERNRREVGSFDQTEKADGFIADGFGSIDNYYASSYVEFLTFYGDIYDRDKDKLMVNRIITIVDRAYVVENKPNPSWLGMSPIYHCGWRTRPDNLYAMGPLDNLVGMQYRIDHLENLKADVFDQIALPMLKIRGDVEDFEYEPGGRIYMGEEGDVMPLVPDGTALQADMQIQALENKMEELAGAPRNAMGIRTPGEKTAFEVQTLDNAASRIFTHKAGKFEKEFLEPAINAMLEAARRNMIAEEVVESVDSNKDVTSFMSVTREDITGNGSLLPMGARHFAERAQRIQTLTQLMQLKAADPTVAPHISGKEIARILSEELREPNLFGDNITIQEQLETQQAMQNAEATNIDTLGKQAELGL